MLGRFKLNEIYNEDSYKAIKDIPDKSVDLVIIDPPYEIVAGGGGGAFGVENRDYHKEVSKKLNYGITNDILEEICRIQKLIYIYIWCNKNQLRQYLNFYEEKSCNIDVLVWCKTNPIPTCNNKYLSDVEYCIVARGDGTKIYGTYETKSKFYVSEINKSDKNLFDHPTIKPIEIIKNFIINSSNENDIIADFFLGSGTTCVAAKELGRRYIGFEIDEGYYKIAKDRLNEINQVERKQMDKGQMSLF